MDQPKTEGIDRLVLREWQIWFTYASFYKRSMPPLETVAENLVKFGVAESSMTSDGDAWWSNDDIEQRLVSACRRRNPIGSGHVDINLLHGGRRARVAFPGGIRGYAAQSLHDAVWLRWAELFLLGDAPIPPRYVSAHLGACTFVAAAPEPYALVVYPRLKIYESGVVSLDLRMFSPGRPVELQKFVEHYVNAPMAAFQSVLVPPGIVGWSPLALPEGGTHRFHRRPVAAIRQFQHDYAVARRARIDDMGDFSFAQVAFGAARDDQVLADVQEEIGPGIVSAAQRAGEARAIQLGVPEAFFLPDSPNRRSATAELGGEFVKGLPDIKVIEAEMTAASLNVVRRMTPEQVKSAIRKRGPGIESFDTLALSIMQIAGFVGCSSTDGPRNRIALSLLGPGVANTIGNHWTGRPHVYLIRFSNQEANAKQNERRFAASFGAIMGRTVLPDIQQTRQFLPKSLRPLGDFAAYISSAITLWVHPYQAREVKEDEIRDLNRGELVYEHQAKVQILEYGYALHRRIGEHARDNATSPHALSNAERDLSDFEWGVQDVGRFGEVRTLIDEGLKAFGVPELRERIANAIRVRRDAATYASTAAQGSWTAFLTGVAGMLAVPSVIDSVLKPLWSLLGLPRPKDGNAFDLLLALFAVAFLTIVLGIGYRALARRSAQT